MRYLHTMVRISNIEESLNFYCELLGLIESRRIDSSGGRYTNIFLCAPLDKENYELNRSPALELTYNWDPEKYDSSRNFGHLAFRVKDIREGRSETRWTILWFYDVIYDLRIKDGLEE